MRSIAEGEEALIRRAIIDNGGNLTLAARQLHIAKSTLYVKMQRYGLSREVLARRPASASPIAIELAGALLDASTPDNHVASRG